MLSLFGRATRTAMSTLTLTRTRTSTQFTNLFSVSWQAIKILEKKFQTLKLRLSTHPNVLLRMLLRTKPRMLLSKTWPKKTPKERFTDLTALAPKVPAATTTATTTKTTTLIIIPFFLLSLSSWLINRQLMLKKPTNPLLTPKTSNIGLIVALQTSHSMEWKKKNQTATRFYKIKSKTIRCMFTKSR